MNNEINSLKSQIKLYQSTIKMHQSCSREAEEKLKALQKQVDETVVDGLRMKVREFIAQATEPVKLRRLQQIKWEDRTPFLQDQSIKWSWHFCTLTEEEALYLWRHYHEYNIDISEWVTYRATGEIG